MKTKSYLIGLLLLAGFIIANRPIPAQNNLRQEHAVIFIHDADTYHRGENGEYIQTGFQVKWIETSPGAPTVEVGTGLASAIAYYMNLGYSHEIIYGRLHLFKK